MGITETDGNSNVATPDADLQQEIANYVWGVTDASQGRAEYMAETIIEIVLEKYSLLRR